jgi:hypothetical protein
MTHAVEIGSSAVIYIRTFLNSTSDEKNIQTNGEQDDLISLLLHFNKESRLNVACPGTIIKENCLL